MTPEQMNEALKKAMGHSAAAVWEKLEDEEMSAEGYSAYMGSVVDGVPKHRYLVLAKNTDPETARGTYTDVMKGLLINLPVENAWTLFEEAIKYKKT